MNKPTALLLFIFLTLSCKKTIEIKEVEVEKKYSWTELKTFTGTEKIILSSGSSADAIYLQQPFFFSELKNQDINNGITIYAANLPANINIRMPITSNFSVYPYSDSAIRVINNLYPNVSPSGGYFDLKKIDPTLTAIQTYYLILFKTMQINKNGTILLSYYNNRASRPFTLMMLKIKTNAFFPYADTVFSRSITLPRTSLDGYVRHIAAINDYFLIDLSGEGIFKITEDGSFKKVYNTKIVDAFYQWQGKVYAHTEWGNVLVSTENGDNWQEFTGINDAMTLSNYYVVKDSLVGVNRDNIFTLTWNGPNYTQRFLKNDGVETTRINGIEVLRDSVYLATTSGVFVKPASTFFESK